MAIDDQAAADAGTEDDAEHDRQPGSRSIDGFGKREAVGIVGQPDRARRAASPDPRERGRPFSHVEFAFFTSPVAGDTTPGMPMPTVASPTAASARVTSDGDGLDRRAIVAARRRDAMPELLAAIDVERNRLDLRAAEIYADAHRTSASMSDGVLVSKMTSSTSAAGVSEAILTDARCSGRRRTARTVEPDRPDARCERARDVGDPRVADHHRFACGHGQARERIREDRRVGLGYAHRFRYDEHVEYNSRSRRADLALLLLEEVIRHDADAGTRLDAPRASQPRRSPGAVPPGRPADTTRPFAARRRHLPTHRPRRAAGGIALRAPDRPFAARPGRRACSSSRTRRVRALECIERPRCERRAGDRAHARSACRADCS